jgi:site-specific DNA recombinase
LFPSFAPLGYVNTLGPGGKRIIVPDLVLGPMITNLFTWFASGEYSLKALARKAYEEGFRFRQSRNKIPVTTLHKILRKRIYTGEFDYGGSRYQGVHEALVTGAVWERCQEILDSRHEKKHRKVKHDFAFSGLVRCGHCGCSLVGEMKKGRYVYYLHWVPREVPGAVHARRDPRRPLCRAIGRSRHSARNHRVVAR